MTVDTLLQHFTYYPEKIVYFDEYENIEDSVRPPLYEFLKKYGDYRVISWEYINYADTLSITIKR